MTTTQSNTDGKNLLPPARPVGDDSEGNISDLSANEAGELEASVPQHTFNVPRHFSVPSIPTPRRNFIENVEHLRQLSTRTPEQGASLDILTSPTKTFYGSQYRSASEANLFAAPVRRTPRLNTANGMRLSVESEFSDTEETVTGNLQAIHEDTTDEHKVVEQDSAVVPMMKTPTKKPMTSPMTPITQFDYRFTPKDGNWEEESLRAKVQALQTELHNTQEQLRIAAHYGQTLYEEKETLDEQLRECMVQMEDYASQVDHLNALIKQEQMISREENRHLNERREQLEQEVAMMNDSNYIQEEREQELESDLREYKVVIEGLEQEKQGLKDELRMVRENASRNINELTAEMAVWQEEHMHITEQSQQLQVKVNELTKENQRLEREISTRRQAEDDIADQRKKISQLRIQTPTQPMMHAPPVATPEALTPGSREQRRRDQLDELRQQLEQREKMLMSLSSESADVKHVLLEAQEVMEFVYVSPILNTTVVEHFIPTLQKIRVIMGSREPLPIRQEPPPTSPPESLYENHQLSISQSPSLRKKSRSRSKSKSSKKMPRVEEQRDAVVDFLTKYSDIENWIVRRDSDLDIFLYEFRFYSFPDPIYARMSYLYPLVLYMSQVVGVRKRCFMFTFVLLSSSRTQMASLATNFKLILDTLRYHNNEKLWKYIFSFLYNATTYYKYLRPFVGSQTVVLERATQAEIANSITDLS